MTGPSSSRRAGPHHAPTGWTWLSLGLAAGAFVLSVIAVTRNTPTPPSSHVATSTASGDAELRRKIAELEHRLGTARPLPLPSPGVPSDDPDLEARIAALESRAPTAPTASAKPGVLKNGSPRYVKFDVPYKSVSVRQEDDGSLAVTNSDPKLAQKTIVISAQREDGGVEDVSVVVPPP